MTHAISRRLMLAGAFAFALPFSVAQAAGLMSAPDAYAGAEAGELVLVDIRTKGEWRETGLPENALPISMTSPSFLSALETAVEGDKTRRVAFICATGGRSGWLVAALSRFGYTDIVDVSEGMEGSRAGPGWRAHGLPIVAYSE